MAQPRPADLIETFPIHFPIRPPVTWTGELYGTHRRGGRRIVVPSSRSEEPIFDSGDCYDLANAKHAFERWLRNELAAIVSNVPEVGAFGEREEVCALAATRE